MTQIIDTSGTTAGNNIVAGEGYENIYVVEGVTRSATPGHAIYSQYIGTEVMVNGNLYGDSDCISLVNSSGDFGDFNINVSNTGSVIGDGDGIFVADSDNTISNNGEIVGMDGHGVNNNGNNFSFSKSPFRKSY